MKKIDNKLLFELVKNSKKSDRELAKVLGVSQPTVTRTRRRLEKEAKIKEYTAILDWAKIGYEIAAFTLVSANISGGAELNKKAQEWTKNHHEIIFACGGQGLGMNGVMVSMHKDYSSFLDFISQFRRDWADVLKDLSSFVVSLKTEEPFMVKPLSFRYLAET